MGFCAVAQDAQLSDYRHSFQKKLTNTCMMHLFDSQRAGHGNITFHPFSAVMLSDAHGDFFLDSSFRIS